MKITKNLAKRIAVVLSCFTAFTCTAANLGTNPIQAEAGWHWDWWNSYEDDCTVLYEQVGGFDCYKVIVMSADGCRYWTNNTPSVPYWFPASSLADMIGYYPGYKTGTATCDVRCSVLNDKQHFAKFTTTW